MGGVCQMKKKKKRTWKKQEADARKALKGVGVRIEQGGVWGRVRKPVRES